MYESQEKYFPINSIESLCDYIGFEAEQEEPCLAIISLVLGFYECALSNTKRRLSTPIPVSESGEDESRVESSPVPSAFPVLNFGTVLMLLQKFVDMFKDEENSELNPLSIGSNINSERKTVKLIADSIWAALSNKYCRDKPHIQFLFSLVTCVSFAVVAACQYFGLKDVHLNLSEDHSWVSFGLSETCEVTWHAKSSTSEDRRGLPIPELQLKGGWLYLDGKELRFVHRKEELAAFVNALNPILESGVDCYELVAIQQRLLKILFDKGILENFPWAVANMANLMELLDMDWQETILFFEKAILSAKENFANRHVFPYIYYGGYLLRNSCLWASIWCWAEASNVLASYSYQRDDEEIYKEMYEFAVDTLPSIFKTNAEEVSECIKEPLGFAILLKFYDGLCLWEEGSHTPVIHITWSKAISSCLSKFPQKVRSKVLIFEHATECQLTIANWDGKMKDIEKSAIEFLCKVSSLSFFNGEEVGTTLRSNKMKAIKELLFVPRLKPEAIQLQLTAQTWSRSSISHENASASSSQSDQNIATHRTRRRRN